MSLKKPFNDELRFRFTDGRSSGVPLWQALRDQAWQRRELIQRNKDSIANLMRQLQDTAMEPAQAQQLLQQLLSQQAEVEHVTEQETQFFKRFAELESGEIRRRNAKSGRKPATPAGSLSPDLQAMCDLYHKALAKIDPNAIHTDGQPIGRRRGPMAREQAVREYNAGRQDGDKRATDEILRKALSKQKRLSNTE